MLKIGDFSRLGHVTIKTLRHYDRINLLKPAHIDPLTGYRYYTVAQLDDLERILALKDLDLSLQQIIDVVGGELTDSEVRGMLRMKRAELRTQIADTQERLRRVEARLRELDREATQMQETITIREVPTQRVLAYRAVIPDTSVIGKTFADATRALEGKALPLAPAPWLALYHHDEYRETNLDFEIAIPVPADFSGTLDLGEGRMMTVRDLPAQTMACITIHLTGQEAVRAGNRALARWVEAQGYAYEDAPCRESYGEPTLADGTIHFESQFPITQG